MKFPWHKYKELEVGRRNTLQIFITNKCNLSCKGCFSRKIMQDNQNFISIIEYKDILADFKVKKGEQINLIGGEPLLHPELRDILQINKDNNIKTTIYTNGLLLDNFLPEDFESSKVRVSVYSYNKDYKPITRIKTDIPIDICFMVGKKTTVVEITNTVNYIENNLNCNVLFISSIRELDNSRKEFFDDTDLSLSILKYKEIVHNFLNQYDGNLEIHVSKRGVFESTVNKCHNKCQFANYFIGGKIIQCPYDIVNLKFQDDYQFNKRYCNHNSTCLMSKVVYKKYENNM